MDSFRIERNSLSNAIVATANRTCTLILPTILKIAGIGAVGFIVPYATLAMVTNFLLLPSLTISGLLTLSAIASYAPPNGIPIAFCILAIVCVFSISLFLISSAGSAVPQRSGPVIIPITATFLTFAALMLYGFKHRRSRQKP
jgi:hypothetical protein